MKLSASILLATAALVAAQAPAPAPLLNNSTGPVLNRTTLEGYSLILSNDTVAAFNKWCEGYTYFCSLLSIELPKEGYVIDPRIAPKQLPRTKKPKVTTVTATTFVTATAGSTEPTAGLGKRYPPGTHKSNRGEIDDMVRPQHPNNPKEMKIVWPLHVCSWIGMPCFAP